MSFDQFDNTTGEREARQRLRMVRRQLVARGIVDERVLRAMAVVPRHEFIPEVMRYRAYTDGPVPIGHEQTISQPYIVAVMTELLELREGDRILEVGTGCGYQTAVLAELGAEVFSVEVVPELGRQARQTLERLGYRHVHLRVGDGWAGWPEEAPFDRIIVTAAPPSIPDALVQQLAPGGRLVVPVGEDTQRMTVVRKDEPGKVRSRELFGCRFVPMVQRELA